MLNPLVRGFRTFSRYRSDFGLPAALLYVRGRIAKKTPLFSIRIPEVQHAVNLRACTTDTAVYRQIFDVKQYDVSLPFQPQTILDAGANIGLASIFYANKYPNAKIIAVEPERANFEVLKRNVSPYPNIKALNAALWHTPGELTLVDSGTGNHGFQTSASCRLMPNQYKVPSVTIDGILRDHNWQELDLLKIDIEGSEKEVFENSVEWISKVRAIMAEIHDAFKPGCSTAFELATVEFKNRSVNGETLVAIRA